MTDAALGFVGVVAVTFAVGLQYGRGELFGLDGRSAGTRVSPQLPASSPGRPSSPRRIEGIDVQGWHARAVRNRRAINRLRRVLLASPSVTEALNLAAATYGHGAELWRKARCETGGTFDPNAHNPSGASGLLQFLPSTWASTPYRGFDVYSPYANALAAGWMHDHGRGGEWECP